MSKYESLVDHLPSLYRPESGEENLYNRLLNQLGHNMDDLGRDLTLIMQAHWFKTADKASYDPHFLRARELAGQPPVRPQDPDDQRQVNSYPYLLDLARLGSLLSIPPRREPVAVRETVEEYRSRLLKIIRIYQRGLGTLNALREMVAAELPEEPELGPARRQRSFSLEENAPFPGSFKSIKSIGLPADELGPLMRWRLSNNGLHSGSPTVYIEGITPSNQFSSTENPMIERFSPDEVLEEEGNLVAIGLGYRGTIPPGKVLQLQPGYSGCLCGPGGLLLSDIHALQVGIRSWNPVPGTPPGNVKAVLQTADRMLWLALDNSGDSQLWRYNGSDWLQVAADELLPAVHCLVQRGQRLLVGHQNGLAAIHLYPTTPGEYQLTQLESFSGQAVFCCHPSSRPDIYYIGSSDGLRLLDASDTITEILITGTTVRAICENDTSLLFGGELGLIQYQSQSGRFFYLSAEFESELEDDWLYFDKEELPTEPGFGLPTVHALSLDNDGGIWIGTERGLARYRSRHEGKLVYRNLLEGFTDLTDGLVSSIVRDEHGYIWFTTDRGLLRFDGRDLARFDMVDRTWQQLGQADSIYSDLKLTARGVWRFQRILNRWENFDYGALQWTSSTGSPELPEEPYSGLVFLDRVRASLGTLDDDRFTEEEAVEPEQLAVRCKPETTRITEGGIAALPRVVPGKSWYRYLQIEPDDIVDGTDLPWWSVEGRLVLPPDHGPPYPGRFHQQNIQPYQLDQMVFAYNPSARVKIGWSENNPLQVIVRLLQRNESDQIDPAIIDRIWRGINQVRPAGVQVMLAVEDTIVRGNTI